MPLSDLFREQEWRDPDDSELVEMHEQTARRRLMAQAQRGQGKAKNR